jgi:hypothetical protein
MDSPDWKALFTSSINPLGGIQPARPQVCMDEINMQLLSDTRDPLPLEPGKPIREDYEYERHGVCNAFLACEPLTGKRSTMVAAQRT